MLSIEGEKIKEVTTMAIGLKSRIIYRVKEKETNEENYWAGEYKLLMKAKSIPSPFGSPNMVDTSTLEDLVETQEQGRRSAGSMEVQGAFEKQYKDELANNEGKKLDILGFIGTESFSPDEATEEQLTGTATIAVSTVPRWIEKDYDVTVVEDENGYPTSITLKAKASN